MKKTITSILAASLLASIASAQLWVENTSATNLTFSFRGLTGGPVNTSNSELAGGRVTINLTNIAATSFNVSFNIENLSGLNTLVGNPSSLVSFGPGVFTGLGFSVQSPWTFTTMNAVTGWASQAPGSFSPSPTFSYEVGAETTNGTNDSIPGLGANQTFVFNFSKGAMQAAPTIASVFEAFAGGSYFVFRIQATGGQAGSDKVGIDLGGGPPFGNPVPEPSTYGLIGAMALLGLMVVRQIRRR